jgi:2,3-bisphosphoglycerate-independent phosphoglycerate mutase
MSKPTALIILDGFGYNPNTQNNAVAQAVTPHIDEWMKTYPTTLLNASGTDVGLLPHTIGNSEVGHTTIGAGRIIPQPVLQLHEAIDNGTFFNNQSLKSCLNTIKKNNGTLHIMGLLSDAGVHSHIENLFAFIKAAQQAGIKNIIVHPFLDGRDVPPKSAKRYLQQLDEFLTNSGIGFIGSIHGRFYAMDRDKNWERTRKSYDVLTHQHSSPFQHWQQALTHFYEKGITDEFIPPTPLSTESIIKENDGIIFFNFRPDRARQLTQAFTQPDFKAFPISNISLSCFLTPFPYDQSKNYHSMYPFKIIGNTLLDILHKAHKKVFIIGETEKYAHITYFFAGGREKAYNNEKRILIPSIPAKNYIEHPEMSAAAITDAVLNSLKTDPADFYLINYANPDMVGHSGNLPATIKAIEFLDKELYKLYKQIITTMDGTIYITADHGNAEEMIDLKTGQPRTAHTTNKVPFIMIEKSLKGKYAQLPLQGLKDIAPFILKKLL